MSTGEVSEHFVIEGNTIEGFATGITMSRRTTADVYADVVMRGNEIDHASPAPVEVTGVRLAGGAESVACLSGNVFGPGVTSPVSPATVDLACAP
jgi:hypothetical protein